jgi:plastocyanin
VLSRWPLPFAIAALLAVPASAADEVVNAGPGIQWSPDEVTIDMGDKVTWKNAGGIHNVDFDDDSYTQPPNPDDSNWSVERTFNTAGIFRYHCGLHGSAMTGVVRVRDASGNVPRPAPGLTIAAKEKQGLARLLDKGLRLRARCANGCDLTAKLTLAPKTAKRFGFAKRRKAIGRRVVGLPVDQTVTVNVPLKQAVEDELADAKRPFKVRLDVRATNETDETARKTIKITP